MRNLLSLFIETGTHFNLAQMHFENCPILISATIVVKEIEEDAKQHKRIDGKAFVIGIIIKVVKNRNK